MDGTMENGDLLTSNDRWSGSLRGMQKLSAEASSLVDEGQDLSGMDDAALMLFTGKLSQCLHRTDSVIEDFSHQLLELQQKLHNDEQQSLAALREREQKLDGQQTLIEKKQKDCEGAEAKLVEAKAKLAEAEKKLEEAESAKREASNSLRIATQEKGEAEAKEDLIKQICPEGAESMVTENARLKGENKRMGEELKRLRSFQLAMQRTPSTDVGAVSSVDAGPQRKRNKVSGIAAESHRQLADGEDSAVSSRPVSVRQQAAETPTPALRRLQQGVLDESAIQKAVPGDAGTKRKRGNPEALVTVSPGRARLNSNHGSSNDTVSEKESTLSSAERSFRGATVAQSAKVKALPPIPKYKQQKPAVKVTAPLVHTLQSLCREKNIEYVWQGQRASAVGLMAYPQVWKRLEDKLQILLTAKGPDSLAGTRQGMKCAVERGYGARNQDFLLEGKGLVACAYGVTQGAACTHVGHGVNPVIVPREGATNLTDADSWAPERDFGRIVEEDVTA
ncbi:hypothetical protein LTS10_009079 [Elasticomyces elasticus]|nr:hypothetical protein LTS10_009079 [Elasticomyces elasticus]